MLKGKSIKDERTDNGSLSTLVTFYSSHSTGRLPSQNVSYEKLFDAWAEVYNPSMKDIEIMRGTGVKQAVTIKFRNPFTSYEIKNDHFVKLHSAPYKDTMWEIITIRIRKDYITVLLKGD